MDKHFHKWVQVKIIHRHWLFGGKQLYSKCECGMMRHDNDGEIFDPKKEGKRLFKK